MKMPKVTSRVTVAVFVLMCAIIMLADGQSVKKVCSSVHVRNNVSNFEKLRNCTVVEGYVQIDLLDKTEEKDFVNLTFPLLTEISQYLVVYRVKGLSSLGHLFPNLALIRGTSLMGNAALAIFENPKLQDIGLKSLTHILEGSIIISKNFNLCYATSIDWDVIMKANTSQTLYDVIITQNKEEKDCNSKYNCHVSGCEGNFCWKSGQCQLLKLDPCHKLCAGGCSVNNSSFHCFACKGVWSTTGECVTSCPAGSFEYLRRTCITEEDCKTRTITKGTKEKPRVEKFFTFNGSCISECPSRWKKNDQNDSCVSCSKTICQKDCFGRKTADTSPPSVRITTVSESKSMQSCTRIVGSLIIDGLTGSYHTGIESALEENLGMIETITGRLEILHSHALVSLNFLRNLKMIEGNPFNSSHTNVTEEFNKYTLIVKDNKNLQQLWDWEKRPRNGTLPFQIQKGKIFFHFNPKLCTLEIEKLAHVANIPTSFSTYEVSKESNGHQTICNPSALSVTVERKTHNNVILVLHIAQNTTTESMGLFMVFYKESTEEHLNQSTLYESISECGDNNWKTTTKYYDPTSSNGTMYVILPHLEPAVTYVYFVRSYQMHLSISTSPIQSVTTLPAQPSAPLDFRVVNATESEMTVSWKPPSHPHGKITHYVVKGYWQTDLTEDIRKRDYCLNKMQKNENLASKPNLPTTTAPPDKGNCKCNNDTEKEKFEYCNSFEHVSSIDKKTYSDLETCDAFIYSVMNSNFQEISSTDGERKGAEMPAPETPHEAFPIRDTLDENGRFKSFRMTVNANETRTVVRNLKHFSEYIVFISACQDSSTEVRNPCSRDAILSMRTDRRWDVDRVDEDRIRIDVNNQTANVTWEEPYPVNSFVHSYILEYRSKDVENSKYIENCVTSQQFKQANGTWMVENLPSGHYQLRLRAVSLAGEGPYATQSFYIEEQGKNYMSIIISSVIVMVILLCIMILFLYYWRLKITKNRILFASVNPRYEPVYVEDHWEVPREHLTLVKQLGRGTFGSVHEGILQPDNMRCAVKTVTAVSEEDNMIFLKEATLMKEFHKAFHIVKLIGVISKGTPVYVIMELMELGDLKSFLLRNASELCDDNKTLPENMIFKMAAEIADGMAFLEAKKFVHRDLAARNCMVSGDRIIKIGDFGLARDIYETDYYRKGDKGTLPIRWMAPESIRDGIFTSNSDVWSFGVVLWEITTLAQMPYHPRTNEEVIKYVQSGQILDVPWNAHPVLRPLMRCCWRWHASHRPKFAQILKLLDSYVDHNFRKVSFYHNGENPNDPANVVPCRSTTDECYIYSDANDEINLYLSQSPTPSTSTPLGVSMRYVPNRANGHIENLR